MSFNLGADDPLMGSPFSFYCDRGMHRNSLMKKLANIGHREKNPDFFLNKNSLYACIFTNNLSKQMEFLLYFSCSIYSALVSTIFTLFVLKYSTAIGFPPLHRYSLFYRLSLSFPHSHNTAQAPKYADRVRMLFTFEMHGSKMHSFHRFKINLNNQCVLRIYLIFLFILFLFSLNRSDYGCFHAFLAVTDDEKRANIH